MPRKPKRLVYATKAGYIPGKQIPCTPCPQDRVNYLTHPVMIGSRSCMTCNNYAGRAKESYTILCRDN